MKKLFLILITVAFYDTSINAQSMKETFDSNSLNWNECASESNAGKSLIDKGVLTITSKGEKKDLWGYTKRNATYFTCFCYAPLNVTLPFKVSTNVTIQKLDEDRIAGLIFNYKDDGNFYAFVFNEEEVRFLRYVNMEVVGYVVQSVKWQKKRRAQQNWRLESDGSTLKFFVDELPIMNVRYMPLEYAGFGYYTYGKQKLIVDDVEFFQ